MICVKLLTVLDINAQYRFQKKITTFYLHHVNSLHIVEPLDTLDATSIDLID